MATKDRASRRVQTIDHTAVKFIRMVLASYIMAVGVGLINGFDAHSYFHAFLPDPVSSHLSKVFVVFCGWMLFLGYLVRLVSLCLAIVIFTASVQTNLMAPITGSIDAFWNDLVLICGLMASYCTLSNSQLRKQAVISENPHAQYVMVDEAVHVVPRRIVASDKKSVDHAFLSDSFGSIARQSEVQFAPEPEPAIAAPDPVRPARRAATINIWAEEDFDDTENIFA